MEAGPVHARRALTQAAPRPERWSSLLRLSPRLSDKPPALLRQSAGLPPSQGGNCISRLRPRQGQTLALKRNLVSSQPGSGSPVHSATGLSGLHKEGGCGFDSGQRGVCGAWSGRERLLRPRSFHGEGARRGSDVPPGPRVGNPTGVPQQREVESPRRQRPQEWTNPPQCCRGFIC